MINFWRLKLLKTANSTCPSCWFVPTWNLIYDFDEQSKTMDATKGSLTKPWSTGWHNFTKFEGHIFGCYELLKMDRWTFSGHLGGSIWRICGHFEAGLQAENSTAATEFDMGRWKCSRRSWTYFLLNFSWRIWRETSVWKWQLKPLERRLRGGGGGGGGRCTAIDGAIEADCHAVKSSITS